MIDSFRGSNLFLSNFAAGRIEYEGLTYPSAEHAFQAAKFTDEHTKKFIAALKSPVDAKKFGRENMRTRVPNWGSIRVEVMRDIVRIKFSKDPFRHKLLGTGDEELVEGNHWGDKFWGMCDGEGANNLGLILMEIRNELKSSSGTQVSPLHE